MEQAGHHWKADGRPLQCSVLTWVYAYAAVVLQELSASKTGKEEHAMGEDGGEMKARFRAVTWPANAVNATGQLLHLLVSHVGSHAHSHNSRTCCWECWCTMRSKGTSQLAWLCRGSGASRRRDGPMGSQHPLTVHVQLSACSSDFVSCDECSLAIQVQYRRRFLGKAGVHPQHLLSLPNVQIAMEPHMHSTMQ